MIFLSASIPDPKRNEKYFNSADIIAIRDSVRALATVVIPASHLVWGGHPAISPLIRYVLSTMNKSALENVTMYQSDFFKIDFPKDNAYFERVIHVDQCFDKKSSLEKMRLRMLKEDGHNYVAGIFIGGMEGVEEEFEIFKKYNKHALLLPMASTGGAAKFIYEKGDGYDVRLKNEYAYMDLFKSLVI